jgi:glucosamine 6-phosphate synthetase-like amidotransferase/phosphosugar isomerase protein
MNYDIYNYILESADTVKKIIAEKEETLRDALDYLAGKDIRRFVVLGSGTSYHACVAAKKSMAKSLRIPVECMYPLDFKDGEIVRQEGTAVIGISQAGRSTSTILALKRAKELGYYTIACTSEADTPVQAEGDCWLHLNVGEELSGPKTKGFIGSIAELALFAAMLAVRTGRMTEEEEQALEQRLTASSENIPDIAAKAKTWAENNLDELSKCRRLVIVGYESCIGAMMEGSLKILEGVRCSVTGYQMEEFMHGIYHSIWENDYIIYLAKPGEYYSRLKGMLRYFDIERNAHQFVVTSDKEFLDNTHAFVYPFKDDEDFASMEYVVPLQVITKVVSQNLGIDCNIPSDTKFHQKMGSYQY